MLELYRFIDWWNGYQEKENISQDIVEEFANSIAANFVELWSLEREQTVSVSKLGKPVVDTILDYRYPEDTMEGTLKYILMHGHYSESLVVALMKHKGLPVSLIQEEIMFYGVAGHIDMMVDTVLLDVKAMSQTYFNKFTATPDDERAYLTQLSCYAVGVQQKGYKVTDVAFLCINKSTGFMKLVKLDLGLVNKYANKGLRNLRLIEQYWNAADEDIPVPEPVPEIKHKVYTGKLKVPASLQYSRHRDRIYPIDAAGFIDREVWEALGKKTMPN